MRKAALLWIAALLLVGGSAVGQEYSITNPTQQVPAPVYLTQPVHGSVEVTNAPTVQDVRIVGGKPDEPIQVQGDVGLKVNEPVPVEVMNPTEGNRALQISGTVKVDDTQPIRVRVDNTRNPENPSLREFAAYAFRGRFSPTDEKLRDQFRPHSGRVFYLTDLIVDTHPDAPLRVRVLAAAHSLVGSVTGGGTAEIPVLVLDLRRASGTRLSTPVPIEGDFAVEVESMGPNHGASFSAVASGYLVARQ